MPEIAGVSAGGMPTRVKCLHVHVAHALAAGPGVNPFGDETLDRIGPWWTDGPCVSARGRYGIGGTSIWVTSTTFVPGGGANAAGSAVAEYFVSSIDGRLAAGRWCR